MIYGQQKELKDVGFPQGGRGYFQCSLHLSHRDFKCECETTDFPYVYVPTLAELIQECGSKLLNIRRVNNDNWEVISSDSEYKPFVADSLEDAMVELYLAIKAK